MVLPVAVAAARAAASSGGRATASRGAAAPVRAAAPQSERSAGSQASGRNAVQRAREVRRDVRQGRVRDKQGRNVTHALFTGEQPSALLYLGVSMIALFKDLLDLVGIGSLPGIGTVVTICFGFLIWILLTVFDTSSNHTGMNIRLIRGLVTIFFTLVEAVGFGLNFLPIMTLTVIVLYYLARRAYKHAKEEAEKRPVPDEPAYA